MPVGDATLGRIMNVLGDPVDERGKLAFAFALIHFMSSVLLHLILSLPTSDPHWHCAVTGPIKTDLRLPIHRPPPTYTQQGSGQEILITGIKVVDLLAPYAKGKLSERASWQACIHLQSSNFFAFLAAMLNSPATRSG